MHPCPQCPGRLRSIVKVVKSWSARTVFQRLMSIDCRMAALSVCPAAAEHLAFLRLYQHAMTAGASEQRA